MSVKRYDYGYQDGYQADGMTGLQFADDGALVKYDDYAALEQKLAESQREFRAADATIENLQMKVEKMAAENAGLNNFIASSCYVLAGEEAAWHPAIDHAPETPVINQLSIAESQFLTDVMTAAGLLSCGKRDTQLAQRLADFCVSKRGGSNPAQLRKGAQS